MEKTLEQLAGEADRKQVAICRGLEGKIDSTCLHLMAIMAIRELTDAVHQLRVELSERVN
jgi:hypothetical protein